MCMRTFDVRCPACPETCPDVKTCDDVLMSPSPKGGHKDIGHRTSGIGIQNVLTLAASPRRATRAAAAFRLASPTKARPPLRRVLGRVRALYAMRGNP